MFSRLQSGFLWVDCNFLRAYENWWNRTKVLPDAISYRCATVVPWRFPGHVMVGKWSPHFLSWSYQSRKELSWPIYASKWNNSCCGLNDHMPNRLLIYIYIHMLHIPCCGHGRSRDSSGCVVISFVGASHIPHFPSGKLPWTSVSTAVGPEGIRFSGCAYQQLGSGCKWSRIHS